MSIFITPQPTIRAIALFAVGLLSLAVGLAAAQPAPQETQKQNTESETPAAEPDASFDLVGLFADVSLGLKSVEETGAQLKAAGIKDFKAEVGKQLKDLKGHLFGFRHVNADQFSGLVQSMDVVSSGQQITPVGVTKDFAYLEARVFLTSQYAYVAVVTTELADLPDAVAKKLTK